MRGNGTAAAAGSDRDTSESSASFVIIGGDGDGDGDGNGDRQRFARNLDSKLKKLQRRREGVAGKHAASGRKPVFVTTVKTGIFLDPPPDLAALLGLDHDHDHGGHDHVTDAGRYYSYSSRPRVLYDKQHQRASVPRRTDRRPE